MVRFKDYLLIQYKRIAKLLPGIIILILLVAILLSQAAYALAYSEAYNSEQQRYRLGIVGDTDDEMISLGVYMIGTLDESRYMIELVEYDDEASARAAMREADISAYLVITEEFSDALNAMSNDEKLKYYATSGQKGISNVMMDEIALIATNIIVYSETGICTLRELMDEEGFDKTTRSKYIDDLFLTYITALLNRYDVTSVTTLGLSDGLTTPQYYFLGIFLFFLLLLSFCGISFFLGQRKAGYAFMSSKGLGAAGQIFGEFIPFLSINIACSFVSLFLIAAAVESEIISLEGFADVTFDSMGYLMICLLPVCIMLASLGFLIFEVLIGVINKILVAFMLYIGMGYVSGFFYPRSFFPDIVQEIGGWIPTGVAFSYMGQVLLGSFDYRGLMVIFAYAVAFLGMAIIVRRQKIR